MKPTMSSSAPSFDLSANPPYQINYRAKRAGKHITASKRRVTFQFGFSDAGAIAAGRTEAECRGEEHEVVLVWSHVSGKRHLFLDGREIHMSKAGRGNTEFEYSWQIPGGHIAKIIANATPPMGERAGYTRQFDLELDGMSFFDFARIYELGGTADGRMARGESPPAIAYSGYTYNGMAYESRDEDYVEEGEAPPPVNGRKAESVDLLDSQESADLLDSPLQAASPTSPCGSAPSLLASSSWSSSSASYDEFAPVEHGNEKTFDSISNEIMCAYGNEADAPALTPVESAPSVSRALVPADEENVDAITKMTKNLINLDDITTGPVRPLSKTMQDSPKGRAVPSWALVGRAPTLAEIRDSQVTRQGAGPAKEVMKTHPQHYQYQSQALVAYQGAAFGSGAAQSHGFAAHATGMAYARAY